MKRLTTDSVVLTWDDTQAVVSGGKKPICLPLTDIARMELNRSRAGGLELFDAQGRSLFAFHPLRDAAALVYDEGTLKKITKVFTDSIAFSRTKEKIRNGKAEIEVTTFVRKA